MRICRYSAVLLIWLSGIALNAAQEKGDPGRRYGIDPNSDAYPQDHPKTTLYSVIKAIEAKKIDYLLAQLAEPKFVDSRVALYNGNFEALVSETSEHFANDPSLLQLLKRIAREGGWEADATTASAGLKENKEKRVFFRKVGNRWFFENRQKAKE